MNLQSQLEQFRDDNPYDVDTQAKRLLASKKDDLILYTLALGLATAKQRQRHQEREFIKNIGAAPLKERLVPGVVTGSVVSIKPERKTPLSMKITPGKKARNATAQLIIDVWMVGDKKLGDCSKNDLSMARKRERASAAGHGKNDQFYTCIEQRLDTRTVVRDKWGDEREVRQTIEKIYGEFRKEAAA